MYETGTVLTYIGHTPACKEECGWPCCSPGEGCPWEERVGKKATVVGPAPDDSDTVKVEFEGERGQYFIRFKSHLSEER